MDTFVNFDNSCLSEKTNEHLLFEPPSGLCCTYVIICVPIYLPLPGQARTRWRLVLLFDLLPLAFFNVDLTATSLLQQLYLRIQNNIIIIHIQDTSYVISEIIEKERERKQSFQNTFINCPIKIVLLFV